MHNSRNLQKSERTDMVVYRTRDYSIFKTMDENRAIDPTHKKKLVESLEKHGQYVPIIVDRNGNIIDGQHRFKGLVEKNMPVLYIIRDLDINDVSEMNSKSRNWKMDDYLHNWSKRGHVEYIRLTEIIKNNQDLKTLNVSNYITIFGVSDNSLENEKFRNGEFKISNEYRGKKVLGLYRKIHKYYDGNVNNVFLRTLAKLVMNSKFNEDEFLKKLKMKRWEKVNSNNARDYIRSVEDIYNWSNKRKPFVTF